MIGAAGLGTVTISGSASAKREAYPEVDNPYPEATVADLKQQAAMHPNLNRAAFITTALNDTRELYVATGVQSLAEQPDTIFQLTSSTGFAAYDISWLQDHRIRYWHDGAVYERKVTAANKRFEPVKIREQRLPASQQHSGDH